MKNILFYFLIIILSSCEGYDFKLEIENSTPYDIYVFNHDTSSLGDYPNKVLTLDSYFIPKDSIKKMGSFGVTWEQRVLNSRNKGLNLFVIRKDTINKYHKDTIIKYKKYYRQLFYSLDELEKKEWYLKIR